MSSRIEQVELVQLGDLLGERELLAGGLQALNQIGCPGHQDPVSALDQLVADARDEMRLARARRTKGQQVVAGLKPAVALGQRPDFCLAHRGHGREVEAVQRLARRELRGDQMPLDATLFPLAELQFAQCGQEPFGWPALGVGAGAELWPEPGDGGQTERGEQHGQLGGFHSRGHAAAPRLEIRSS